MRRFAAILLLVLASAAVGAEDRRRILVAFSAPGYEAAKVESFAASLDAALARSSRFGKALRAASPASDPEALAEETARLGFDLALAASVERVPEGLRLSWIIVGPTSGEELDRGSFSGSEPDDRDLSDFFWLELVGAAEKSAAAVKSQGRAVLRIVGPPGALVSGFSDERLELPAEGEIELSLKAPATYLWKARASGFESAEGIVSLFEESASFDLDLKRVRAWTLEVGLKNAAFPDFWASYRLLGDRLFVKAGFEQYLFGLALARERVDYDPPYFLSIRMIEPGLGVGWLFGKAGGETRPYAALTLAARLAFPKDAGFFLDPVAPLQVQPAAGIEWKPHESWGFFLELGSSLYLFGDGILMAGSVGEDRGGTLYAYGETWFLEFPSFRFGARMHL